MLPYSENDICKLYRSAKDKKQQLQILADMNLTGTKEIADIVKKHGYKLPKIKLKSAKYNEPRDRKNDRHKEYIQCQMEGLTLRQTAERLGTTYKAVKEYARRYGMKFEREKKNAAR